MGAHGVTGLNAPALHFMSSEFFGTRLVPLHYIPMQRISKHFPMKPMVIETRARANKANTRTEKAKTINRRMLKKFNGTATKPRLSVFCSEKQLYAMLVDDQNKKCLYYGSTLQESIRGDPPCSTAEAAGRVGEGLIKACIDLDINEVSTYDRNGFTRGERIQAFEVAIAGHGFLPDSKRIRNGK